MYICYVIIDLGGIRPCGTFAPETRLSWLDWADMKCSESIWMIPGTEDD